jgi:6-phosphofructokinase
VHRYTKFQAGVAIGAIRTRADQGRWGARVIVRTGRSASATEVQESDLERLQHVALHDARWEHLPYDVELIARTITETDRSGSKFTFFLVAEGAVPVGGELSTIGKAVGQAVQLGGVGGKGAAELQELSGKKARTAVLGHLPRDGSPTSPDRLLGFRFGAAAVRALESGHNGVMVALDPPDVVHVPLAEATRHLKNVPPECDTMLTARDLRINFGDRMPEISP